VILKSMQNKKQKRFWGFECGQKYLKNLSCGSPILLQSGGKYPQSCLRSSLYFDSTHLTNR